MLTKAVIDISHWDLVSDFSIVAKAGVAGVIAKATEGATYEDLAYQHWRPHAEAAGLKWGAYHFLRPGDMREQAKHFVEVVGLDCELMAADHEDPKVSLSDLKLWLRAVHDMTGRRPIIYSGNVIKDQLGSNRDAELAQYRLWLAQYSAAPDWPKATWPTWWLWQYTERGVCPGVAASRGKCDLNCYAGTADQLRAEWAA